jgi:hypothetical protein
MLEVLLHLAGIDRSRRLEIEGKLNFSHTQRGV